jgi:hypothetical protein
MSTWRARSRRVATMPSSSPQAAAVTTPPTPPATRMARQRTVRNRSRPRRPCRSHHARPGAGFPARARRRRPRLPISADHRSRLPIDCEHFHVRIAGFAWSESMGSGVRRGACRRPPATPHQFDSDISPQKGHEARRTDGKWDRGRRTDGKWPRESAPRRSGPGCCDAGGRSGFPGQASGRAEQKGPGRRAPPRWPKGVRPKGVRPQPGPRPQAASPDRVPGPRPRGGKRERIR